MRTIFAMTLLVLALAFAGCEPSASTPNNPNPPIQTTEGAWDTETWQAWIDAGNDLRPEFWETVSVSDFCNWAREHFPDGNIPTGIGQENNIGHPSPNYENDHLWIEDTDNQAWTQYLNENPQLVEDFPGGRQVIGSDFWNWAFGNFNGDVPGIPPAVADEEQICWDAINDFRVENGLQPLTRDGRIDAGCREWSATMRTEDDMHHDAGLADVISSLGAAGMNENIGKHGINGLAQFKGWKNSPSHRDNLLAEDMTRGGVAYDHGYWTFRAAKFISTPSSAASLSMPTPSASMSVSAPQTESATTILDTEYRSLEDAGMTELP